MFFKCCQTQTFFTKTLTTLEINQNKEEGIIFETNISNDKVYIISDLVYIKIIL